MNAHRLLLAVRLLAVERLVGEVPDAHLDAIAPRVDALAAAALRDADPEPLAAEAARVRDDLRVLASGERARVRRYRAERDRRVRRLLDRLDAAIADQKEER